MEIGSDNLAELGVREIDCPTSVLSVDLYLNLEKAREEKSLEDSFESSSGSGESSNLIIESQHIHNKVIFDCVNEALDFLRPYGKNGEPLPWNPSGR
jgi:hypothetical protein